MAHHVPITSPASSAHSANSTLATYQHHPADQVPRSASPPHPPLEAPPYLAHTEPRSASSSARPPSSSGNPTPRARSPAAGGLPGMSAFSPHHYAPAVMPQRSPGSRKPPPALTLHLPPVSSPTDLYYHPSTAPATFAAATAPSSPLVSASPRLACFWSLVAARDLTILCTPPSLAHHATFDDCRPCRPGTSLLDWIHPDEVHDACQDLTRLLGGPLFRGVEITCRLKLAEVDPRPATTGLPELLRRSSTSKLSELSSGRSCRGSRSAASSEFRARSASIDTLHSPGTAAGSGYTVMRLGVFALSASVALLLVHAPPTVSEGDTTPKCPCAGNTLTSADLNEVRGSLARFQDLQLPPQVEEAVSMSQNSLSAFTFTPPTPIRCVQVLTWPELDTLHTFPYAEIDRLHDQHALSLNQAPDFLHHHILTADGAASLRRTIEAAVQPDHDPLAPLYLRVRTNAPEAEPIFLGATVVPFGTLIFLLLETEMAYTVPYSPARLPSQTNPTEEPRASDEFRLPFQTGGVGASLLPDLRRHSIDVSPSSLTAPLLLPTRRLSLNPQPTDTETLSHSPGDPSSPHWDAPTGQTTPVEGNRLPKIRRVAELALEAVGANYIRPPVAESPNSPGLPSGGNLAASGMRSPLTPDSMTPLPSPSQLVAQLSMDEDYRNALRRASAGVLPPISELPKLRRFSFPLHSRPINSTAAYVEPPAETFPQPGATDSHHPTTSLTVGGSASAASVALCTTSPVYRYQPPATGSPAGGRSGDGPNRAFLPTIPEAPTEVSEGGSSGAGTMALASSEPSRKRPAVGYPAVPPSAPPISRTSTISPGVTPSAHYGPSTPVYTCYPLGGPLSPALHRTFSHELPSPHSPIFHVGNGGRGNPPSGHGPPTPTYFVPLNPSSRQGGKRMFHEFINGLPAHLHLPPPGHHPGSQGSGSGGASAAPKKCERCLTGSSPEWRRGPSGHKTLCNACGLRYSRSLNRASKDGGGRRPNQDKATTVRPPPAPMASSISHANSAAVSSSVVGARPTFQVTAGTPTRPTSAVGGQVPPSSVAPISPTRTASLVPGTSRFRNSARPRPHSPPPPPQHHHHSAMRPMLTHYDTAYHQHHQDPQSPRQSAAPYPHHRPPPHHHYHHQSQAQLPPPSNASSSATGPAAAAQHHRSAYDHGPTAYPEYPHRPDSPHSTRYPYRAP